MNILPLPHFLFLLSQLSSILLCEEFRSSSGYGNNGLSLHKFLLDRLPLSRKHRECSFPWRICNLFLQFPFFRILLNGLLLWSRTLLRDFATILSTLQNNAHHRPPSLMLCLPNVVHVTAKLKRSILSTVDLSKHLIMAWIIRFRPVLNAVWVAPVTAKLSSKTVISKTRDALKAKQKQLKRRGLENRPKPTTALADDEIEILFDKELFGLSSPQAPLNTVWLNNTIHFGLRGCKEQKELRWGNIVLKPDSDGKEYLETLNAKWRLERERIYGIKGRSGRECMSTRMPFLSIVIRCTFTRCTK